MKWHGNVQVSAPPAHEVVPAVPLALSHIVQRMIEKDPDQRFENTEELGRTIKRSFSGKGKRGPGAVAPAAQTQRNAMMARLAAERGLGRLEDEVDYTPGAAQDGGLGPATAPIPKEPMTKGRKVVLAVAVGVMFVGVMIAVVIKMNKDAETRQGLETSAKGSFLEAKSLYDQGKYSEAVPKIKKVLVDHKGTIYAKYSEFLSPLAEGYHAHSVGRYDLARSRHSEAVKAIERLQSTLSNRDEIDTVTGYMVSANKLQDMTVSSDLIFSALARARQAIPLSVGIKQLDVIEQTLRNEITTSSVIKPTRLESKKILAVYSDIRRQRYLMQLGEKMLAADRLVEQKAWDEAVLGYQEVEDYLTGEEGITVLTDETDRAARVKDVRRKCAAISEHLGKEKILSQVREAEASGDQQKMLMAYRMALTSEKISLTEKQGYQNKVNAIELKALVAQAQTALANGQTDEAKRLFGEILKKDPANAIARQALSNLTTAQRTEALLKAAKQAVLDRNYAQGLSLLEKVAEFRQDDEVRSLTTECRYELEMAKARRAISTKDITGAMRYLAAAEQIDPTKAAQVGTIRSTLQAQKKYGELVGQIKTSLKAGEWKRTLELITRARAIRDTQELKDFENQTHYGDLLASGKKALTEGNKDTARWYFKRAQRFVDTAEIKRLLEQVKPETPAEPE